MGRKKRFRRSGVVIRKSNEGNITKISEREREIKMKYNN